MIQKSFLIQILFFESTWDPDFGSDLVTCPFGGPVFDQNPSFSQGFIRGWLKKGGRDRAPAGRAAGQPAPAEKKISGISTIKNHFCIQKSFFVQIFFHSNPAGPEAVQKVDSKKRFRPETTILNEDFFYVSAPEKIKVYFRTPCNRFPEYSLNSAGPARSRPARECF